ncbi:S9 family peptidase [Rheinheimera sediminis]|uniref:alpha/beta hydrolase family protein n=1 Tax=Rheinheimera sp. YQF-1 TaxID=2499626 RepID=UPI000FDCBBB5|nr:S9 family peptidase [Rheinheimera sp. YQF-1]RVT44507.1 S9 family peptidase [Rheinheimera sp. YQF-1]
MKNHVLITIIFFLLYAHSCFAQNNAQLFGNLAMVSDVSVSPDGSSIAAKMIYEGMPTVVTAPFGSTEIAFAAKLKDPADRIESIDWVNKNRLFITASRPEFINGFYVRLNTAYAVNADGSDLVVIENKAAYKKQESAFVRNNQSIGLLNDLIHDDQHVQVLAYDPRDLGYSVFKVNVYTNSFEKIASGAGDRTDFISDINGNILFSTITKKNLTTIYYKAIGSEQWVDLKTLDITGDITFQPVSVSDDGKSILVKTDFDSNFDYIAKFDIAEKRIGDKLFSVDGHDIDNVIIKNGQLVGYGYTKDFYERTFISPQQIEYNNKVKALFKNRHSYITSSSKDGQRVVVYSETDHNPGRYYTIDFATKKADFWLSQYPLLEQQQLAPVQPIDVISKDGQPMRGYLTLPKNKPAPLIVFPHGGPHARDAMGFDPFVQFFAAQGYAVLQVNFRGSSGYGNDFLQQGYKQWGLKMQDDLMDAVDQVRKNPAIDKNKSCVVGASYGGYSALVASFQRPQQFNCFISISGISDLAAMVKRDTEYSEQLGLYMKTAVGDYNTESDKLNAVSALYQIDKIQQPILLVHGVKDTRVSFKQSLELYNKLKSNDKVVEYLELENGTHFFDEEADRKQAFAAMEQFLNRYLPVH